MAEIERFSCTHGGVALSGSAASVLGILLFAPHVEWKSITEATIRCRGHGIGLLKASHLVEIAEESIRSDVVGLSASMRLSVGLGQMVRDRLGRPIQGVPPTLIGSSERTIIRAIDGAFSAAVCQSRATRWRIECPNSHRSLALRGMLRRCGVEARIDASDLRKLNVEATQSARMKELALHLPQLAKQRAKIHTNYDSLETLNQVRRSEQINRTRWALDVVGDQAHLDLREAGRLRIDHPDISLDELGQMMEPPASRHTVCGRLRRLHHKASKMASNSTQP